MAQAEMVSFSQLPRPKPKRLPIRLDRDVRRVVTLPFDVSAYARVVEVFERVDKMTDDEVDRSLAPILEDFSRRHRKMDYLLEEHYLLAAHLAGRDGEKSRERRLLLGAYFTMEYSIEGAALFNPSIVPHPDQNGVPSGALRFIMSLRAVGEGHISSTVFQTGLILSNGAVALDPQGNFSARTSIKLDHHYHKSLFQRKLREMGVNSHAIHAVMSRLPDRFPLDQLESAIESIRSEGNVPPQRETALADMRWLARANYELELGPGDTVSDLILFPRNSSESRGIEDLRLVRFVDDDHSVTYFGTFTGFSGQRMLPMMLETTDFHTIAIHTLNGDSVQNKGMALFPRKVDGHYVMCSRIDGRNLYLMVSDFVYFWETATLLAEPKYPWELRIMGNCGSPIETPEGWLLLTHGVGPMRRYCIGAMLLDLEDPFKIRGRLREPLLEPSEEDREGYVPNVVYSCGALEHNGCLILPYAVSDTATRIATVPMQSLVDQILRDGP